MKRFIEGVERTPSTLFPARLDDYITEDNTVRVIDAFVDTRNLKVLGFGGTVPADTGRPSYHPAVLLKIYLYGYLNRIQSSRRLEREAERNVELMWLTNRLPPDFKTIADFRKDNGQAIRNMCRQFVLLCHQLNMFEGGEVAIDGSKFKAVNNRDKTYTQRKLKARIEQVEASIARYMEELERADRQPELTTKSRVEHITQKSASFKRQIQDFNALAELCNEADVRYRRLSAHHPLGAWIGATHFLTKTLSKVRTEMSLHVLAYNMKRMLQILGTPALVAAMRR